MPSALLGLCLWTIAPSSFADDPKPPATPQSAPTAPSAADVKRADMLFQKARALKKQGKTEEACDLFAESQALDPNGGTLVNLAECHESQGKTGTAWRELNAALKLAKRTENKELVEAIRDRLRAIVPNLCEITIRIPKETSAIPGVAIDLDGAPLAPDIPTHFQVVDPGTHTVHAKAPGYIEMRRELVLTDQARKMMMVVRLDPIPPPPDKRAFYGLLAGSGVGLGVAVVFTALVAASETQHDLWPGIPVGGAAFVGFGIGAIFAYPRSPPAPAAPEATQHPSLSPRFALHPLLGPSLSGVGVTGTF